MNTDSDSWLPLNGLSLMESVAPATSSTGAVSPQARAMASMTPVTMPVAAVGSTIFMIVFHFGMPSAYAPSRSAAGTSRSISSLARVMVGSISTESASAAAKPEYAGRPPLKYGETTATQNARMNRPLTIDGMPVITSTKNRTAPTSRPRPYSTM